MHHLSYRELRRATLAGDIVRPSSENLFLILPGLRQSRSYAAGRYSKARGEARTRASATIRAIGTKWEKARQMTRSIHFEDRIVFELSVRHNLFRNLDNDADSGDTI